jgi:hypothetical protein
MPFAAAVWKNCAGIPAWAAVQTAHLSLQLLPLLPGRPSATTLQLFKPYVLMRLRRTSSSCRGNNSIPVSSKLLKQCCCTASLQVSCWPEQAPAQMLQYTRRQPHRRSWQGSCLCCWRWVLVPEARLASLLTQAHCIALLSCCRDCCIDVLCGNRDRLD